MPDQFVKEFFRLFRLEFLLESEHPYLVRVLTAQSLDEMGLLLNGKGRRRTGAQPA